jgi:hypothetical protein
MMRLLCARREKREMSEPAPSVFFTDKQRPSERHT